MRKGFGMFATRPSVVLASVLLTAGLLVPASGLAQEPAEARESPAAAPEASAGSEEEPEAETPDYLGMLSFRIIAGSSRAYPDNTWVFGFGVQGEIDLGGYFELVLGGGVLLGEASEVFPVELLVKKTLELAPEVGIYAALGPLAAVVTEPEHPTEVLFGGTASVGILLWHTREFGLFVEATYQLLFEEEPVHDIEGAVGIGWRF